MAAEPSFARAATLEDVKALCQALDASSVDYVLIGGWALNALGYQRATVDVDLLLRPSAEQGAKVKQVLMALPDGVAAALQPEWFDEAETIRVADAFVVDLMFSACGETLDSLIAHVREVDLDGVPIRTLDLEGLLKTKRTTRDKDVGDRLILERALAALRSGG